MADDQANRPFSERRSHHRRRVLDGLRLLPLLGVWLFMIPLLWPNAPTGDGDGTSLSYALVYVFLIWLALILAGAGLVSRISRRQNESSDAGRDNG